MEVVRSCETSEQMYDPTWCDNPEGDRTLIHAIYVCSALKLALMCCQECLWSPFIVLQMADASYTEHYVRYL